MSPFRLLHTTAYLGKQKFGDFNKQCHSLNILLRTYFIRQDLFGWILSCEGLFTNLSSLILSMIQFLVTCCWIPLSVLARSPPAVSSHENLFLCHCPAMPVEMWSSTEDGQGSMLCMMATFCGSIVQHPYVKHRNLGHFFCDGVHSNPLGNYVFRK